MEKSFSKKLLRLRFQTYSKFAENNPFYWSNGDRNPFWLFYNHVCVCVCVCVCSCEATQLKTHIRNTSVQMRSFFIVLIWKMSPFGKGSKCPWNDSKRVLSKNLVKTSF